MDRESKEYIERKMCWMMADSEPWLKFLKPWLEERANEKLIGNRIESFDDTYKVARRQARAEAFKLVLDKVMQQADSYSRMTIET